MISTEEAKRVKNCLAENRSVSTIAAALPTCSIELEIVRFIESKLADKKCSSISPKIWITIDRTK